MDKKSIIIISLLLVGLICMSYYQVKTQAKLDTVEQNYKAAEDSLNVLVLQNHELLYEKEAYILREAELNARIGVTEDEVKEIKKKLKSSRFLIRSSCRIYAPRSVWWRQMKTKRENHFSAVARSLPPIRLPPTAREKPKSNAVLLSLNA